ASRDPNRFSVAPQGLQIALIPPDGGSLIRYPAIRSYLTAGDRMQFDQVKRREFISLLGGTVPAWLLAARAQQAKMPVIGYFSGQSPDYDTARLTALRQSPSEACYVEGESIATEYRWVEGPRGRYFGIAGAGRQDIWEHRHHE